VNAEDSVWPIGTAHAVGWVAHHDGLAAMFRLVIDKAEVDGRWLCIARRFVRVGQAAEFHRQ
jgi:hypothetical protein